MGFKRFCHCSVPMSPQYITLRKYSSSGTLLWTQDDGIRPLVMCCTPDGSFVFTGCNLNTGKGQIRKYDGGTGFYQQLPNSGFLNQQVSAIHTDGTLLVVGAVSGGGATGILYAFDLNLNPQWQVSTSAFIQSVRVANSAVYVVLAVASPKPANPVSLQKYDNAGNLKWNAAPPVHPGDSVDPQNYAVYAYPNLVGSTVLTGGAGHIQVPGNPFVLSNRDDGINSTDDGNGNYLGAVTSDGVINLAQLDSPGGYTSFNASGGALVGSQHTGLYLENSAGVIQWWWSAPARVTCTDSSMNVCGGFLSGAHKIPASQKCFISWQNQTSFTLSLGGASANVPWPVTFAQFFGILQGLVGAGNVAFTNSGNNSNIPIGSGGTITLTGALANSIQPAFLSSDQSNAGAVAIFNGAIGGNGFTTASFDASGNPLWTADHSTDNDIGFVHQIATDSNSSTYTAGNRVRV